MHTMPAVLLLAAVVVQQAATPSDPHDAMNHRGAMVMGFDQEKTRHHFRLFSDGGAIEVAVIDPADTANRDAIRRHLPHIAMMFGAGDFDAPMLVHDSANVPGTRVMSDRRDRIVYTYRETSDGGRVDITTKDAAALAAVHEFLRYQIREHRTGDPETEQARP